MSPAATAARNAAHSHLVESLTTTQEDVFDRIDWEKVAAASLSVSDKFPGQRFELISDSLQVESCEPDVYGEKHWGELNECDIGALDDGRGTKVVRNEDLRIVHTTKRLWMGPVNPA